MDAALRRELIAFLEQFITENKRTRIAEVIQWRTRYVTLMLEDIYQSQNASATLRTAEILGVQDVYIAENWNRYKVNPDVALGAQKWIDLHRFRSPVGEADPEALDALHDMPDAFPATAAAMDALRRKGYLLVATTPHTDAWGLDDIPLDRPLAFLFGNEREGLSPYALQHADAHLRLPMYGFTESYNISVSVAITLSHVIEALHRSDAAWRLSEEECDVLMLRWYRRIVGRPEALERAFYRRRGLTPPEDLLEENQNPDQ